MTNVASDASTSFHPLGLRGFLADWVGVFAVFFVYAGELVPGVNEPHYWTKSAHFWDASFGRGDLFLESGNAHWLFYATLGWLTSVLSLPSAVWVARFVLWALLATGWTWMIRSLLTHSKPNEQATDTFSTVSKSGLPLVSTLCGAGWLAGMHWGHWAGEWVVGGAEAKVAAYACIFGALGCFFRGCFDRRQVWWAWLLLGLASAFHIVTGIWVIGCCVLVSLALTDPGAARWRDWANRHVGPLVAAVPLIAVGAVPPLAMDWGAPKEIVGESAVIQVYGRLGHHLAPSLFAEVRWQSFGLLIAFGCLVHWFALKVPFSRWTYGLKWVVLNAWLALGIAVVGALIDAVLGGIDRTLAAKILKFYWFRWNDVAWALGVAAPVTAIAYGAMQYGKSKERTISTIAAGLLVGVGGWLLGTRYLENSEAWIPYGDKARFLSKWDEESARRQQYRDWLAVCDWITQNTDSEGVWLTPRNQQSFKWHTHRPELACTKDMPQNSAAIVEWAKRLDDAYKLDEAKIQLPWSTQRLWELHEKYAVRYVLLDHRVPQQTLPLLPILYPPPDVTNATFSVYEFPAGPSHSSTK